MTITFSKERVETFSDGVFAIVLTLLVLELRVPDIADHSSIGEYARAMSALIPKAITFVLTFLLVSANWISHHYFFRHLNRITLGLLWMNNFLLLSQCLTPFSTALLGDHLTDQFPVLLYAITCFFGGITWYSLRSYASRANLFEKGEYAKTQGPSRSHPALAIFGLSILASFVNVYIALALIFMAVTLYFVTTGLQYLFRTDRVQKTERKRGG